MSSTNNASSPAALSSEGERTAEKCYIVYLCFKDRGSSIEGLGTDLAAAREIMRVILDKYRSGDEHAVHWCDTITEVVIREVPVDRWLVNPVDDYAIVMRETI